VESLRYFEDIPVGEAMRTPARTVTEADLVRFAAISGEYDGLDRGPGGSGPAVPDHLIIALTSGLGFRIPVAQPLVLAFMVLDWRFLTPVRVGDTVHCRMQVTAKRALKEGGVLVERREIVNQRGEVVQEGEYKLLVARRPRSAEGAA
jgi:acyl dehydratase